MTKDETVEEKKENQNSENIDEDSTKSSEDEVAGNNPENEKNRNMFEEFGEQIGKFATNTIDTLKKGVDKALVARNTVLTIRVTDEANQKLTMLVEAGLFKSRSESAAFLIEEGIKQQSEMFNKVGSKMDEINKLRADLKNIVKEELKQDEPVEKSENS